MFIPNNDTSNPSINKYEIGYIKYTKYEYRSHISFLYKLFTVLFSILHLTVSIESLQYTHKLTFFLFFLVQYVT